MGIFDRLFGLDKLVEAKVDAQTAIVTKSITEHLDNSILKSTSSTPTTGNKVLRYQFDPIVQQRGIYSRKKPDSSIPFDVLRKFSVQHEISRAAINYRKRQLARLQWDIVANDKDENTINKAQADAVRLFFKQIGGKSNKYRKFIARITEDLLVLDAVSLYKQQTLGGELFTMLPVDPTTIRLVVDDTGGTPLPPNVAYKQVIRGEVKAEFTTDQMLYDMMNPRTNTPYGLAPLESLLVIVSSSLKAGLANMAFLTEGNIPEGFFGVPKEWTPQMIADFQENWDAVMAGDEGATAKLKFAPEGSYQPAKKMTDMAWQEFNDWLMKVTCALFDVQPSEIGFHPNKGGLGGAGMAQQSSDTSDEKGLQPLAMFIEEMFTEIIHEEMGFTDLKFHFTGLDKDKDAQQEATVNEILIRSGQRTINELRTDMGLDKDPSPQADLLMITSGTPTFLQSQEEIDAGKEMAASIAAGNANQPTTETPPANTAATPAPADDTQKMVALVSEFRKFRKMAIARKKAGKTFRPFTSEILPDATVHEMNDRIEKAKTPEDVRDVFTEFMQDYQINFIADVVELQGNLQKILR
jgi:hypothetical protein